MAVFLELNGYELNAPEPSVVQTMLAVAAGEATEPALTAWVREHLHPIGRD